MGASGILAHPATRKRFILPRIVVRSMSIGGPHTGNNRQGAAVASAAHAHLASRGVTPAPSRPVRRRAINPGLHFSESTAWLSPVSNRIIKRRPYPTNQHRPTPFLGPFTASVDVTGAVCAGGPNSRWSVSPERVYQVIKGSLPLQQLRLAASETIINIGSILSWLAGGS